MNTRHVGADKGCHLSQQPMEEQVGAFATALAPQALVVPMPVLRADRDGHHHAEFFAHLCEYHRVLGGVARYPMHRHHDWGARRRVSRDVQEVLLRRIARSRAQRDAPSRRRPAWPNLFLSHVQATSITVEDGTSACCCAWASRSIATLAVANESRSYTGMPVA